MNLILLQDHHFVSAVRARLGADYSAHLSGVLGVAEGASVTVGRMGGGIGEARISHLNSDYVELDIGELDQDSPPQLPVTLVLGLPRPRMLQRTLQTIATMGVSHLCLVQTQRVEKSYWQTPLLKPEAVHQQLVLGLEQAKATQLPSISFHKRFRTFVEDELPAFTAGKHCVVAHPGDYPPCPSLPAQPTVLAIGPEGGFVPYEINQLTEASFSPVQLGKRILRVETAVPVLLAKLFY